MSEPFIAQINIFAGNFAPRGWSLCDGQLLAISSNSALFSLVGTTYGGDGRTTFGLPDLRGRFPMHVGSGPGLTTRSWGTRSGTERETLTTAQTPNHTHSPTAKSSTEIGNTSSPTGAYPAQSNDGENNFSDSSAGNMAANAVTSNSIGGNQSHNNMPPFLAVYFIIATVGLFPSRN